MLVTRLERRVLVLGDPVYRTTQSPPLPAAGKDNGLIVSKQLWFMPGFEELAKFEQ